MTTMMEVRPPAGVSAEVKRERRERNQRFHSHRIVKRLAVEEIARIDRELPELQERVSLLPVQRRMLIEWLKRNQNRGKP